MYNWSMLISAVVLTHNDGTRIGKTLDNLSFADEIVVIDDESGDDTVKEVKKRKTVIFSRPLNNDFAAQRNFGLAKAKGEWVLFVDSDEVVTPSLREEVLSKVQVKNQKLENGNKERDENTAGYFIKRTDYLFGRELKHGETAGVRLLRLARRDAGIWKRPVHEVWEVKGTIGVLEQPLLHYPHPNVAQFLSDINRYSTLNAAYLHSRHVSVPWWHIIAYPSGKFFMNYVVKCGFLDGVPGLILAVMMSFHSFLSRAKLYLFVNR